MVEVKVVGGMVGVGLREGGAGSHKEWAYLIRGRKVVSFRRLRVGERRAGIQWYWGEARSGDFVVTLYRSGSGKTFVVSAYQVTGNDVKCLWEERDGVFARQRIKREFGPRAEAVIFGSED